MLKNEKHGDSLEQIIRKVYADVPESPSDLEKDSDVVDQQSLYGWLTEHMCIKRNETNGTSIEIEDYQRRINNYENDNEEKEVEDSVTTDRNKPVDLSYRGMSKEKPVLYVGHDEAMR